MSYPEQFHSGYLAGIDPRTRSNSEPSLDELPRYCDVIAADAAAAAAAAAMMNSGHSGSLDHQPPRYYPHNSWSLPRPAQVHTGTGIVPYVNPRDSRTHGGGGGGGGGPTDQAGMPMVVPGYHGSHSNSEAVAEAEAGLYNCNSQSVIVSTPTGKYCVLGPHGMDLATEDPESVVVSLGLAYPGSSPVHPM